MDGTGQERAVTSLVVGEDGRLVIPAAVLVAAGLEPGDAVELERVLPGLLMVPAATEAEMAAFWGPHWREDLERTRAETAVGKSTFYRSEEEFLAALEARRHPDIRTE